jgi:hypothetical protein
MFAFKGQRAFSYLKISVPCGARCAGRWRWKSRSIAHPSRAPMGSALWQVSRVATITASTLASSIERRAPGAARHGGRPTAARRSGLAICTPFYGVALSFRATTCWDCPAQASTMRARNAKPKPGGSFAARPCSAGFPLRSRSPMI